MSRFTFTTVFILSFLTHYCFGQYWVSTFAGGSDTSGLIDGADSVARFKGPWGLDSDDENNIYVVENENHAVRKIDRYGNVTTIAGTGFQGYANGSGNVAEFSQPYGVCYVNDNEIYVTDANNNRIRKIDSNGTVTAYTGSAYGGAVPTAPIPKIGAVDSAKFFELSAICYHEGSSSLFIADINNFCIFRIDLNNDSAYLYAGYPQYWPPLSGTMGYKDGEADSARFGEINGLAVDQAGVLYVADASNHCIRKVSVDRMVTTIAGQGTVSGYIDSNGTNARFNDPRQMTFDHEGNLYVYDWGNGAIRKITTNSGADYDVTTVYQNNVYGYKDGVSTSAVIPAIEGITIDGAGNLYVTSFFAPTTDTMYNTIRKLSIHSFGDTICYEDTASVVMTGGNTYKWYDSETGGNLLHTGTTYDPQLQQTTTFYVANEAEYEDIIRTPVTVYVGASISFGDTVYIDTPNVTSVTLDARNPGADYLWQPSGATSQTIEISQEGNYTVVVIDTNDCVANHDFVVLFGSGGATSISTISKSHLTSKVSPIPFKSELNLSITLKEKSDLDIKVFDINSKEIYAVEYPSLSKGQANITLGEMESFSSGMYYLMITDHKDNVSVRKLMKY